MKYTDFWGLLVKRFSREGGGTIPGEEKRETEGKKEEFEEIGDVGDEYRYEGETYVILTPIIRKKESRVGVAIGYRKIWRKGHGTPLYDREEGLLIFIFDENDEIVEILFFPFSKLETEEGRREVWEKAKVVLGKHRIDIRDFHDALYKLGRYCEKKDDIMGGISGGSTVGGVAGLVVWTEAVIATGGIFFVLAGAFLLEAFKWDAWGDMIVKLQYVVSKDL